MGNPITFMIIDYQCAEFGPVIYSHYERSNHREVIDRLIQTMDGRTGDVEYASARLVHLLCERAPGNLGVGVIATQGQNQIDDAIEDWNPDIIIDCGKHPYRIYSDDEDFGYDPLNPDDEDDED